MAQKSKCQNYNYDDLVMVNPESIYFLFIYVFIVRLTVWGFLSLPALANKKKADARIRMFFYTLYFMSKNIHLRH